MTPDNRFEQLIADAQAQAFSGWDFAYLQGRWIEASTSWNYRERVQTAVQRSKAMLDMGTGGGEFLASLTALPPYTVATEGYAPNVDVAQKRLQPLGIGVIPLTSDRSLPFEDDKFDLIINRHESFDAAEVARILKSGGRFITQQVGGQDNIQLNHLLNAAEPVYAPWSLDVARHQLQAVGLQIVEGLEEYPAVTVTDIGAVVFYLKVISWQIPDFSIETYRPRLYELHQQIETTGPLLLYSHRFLIEAVNR